MFAPHLTRGFLFGETALFGEDLPALCLWALLFDDSLEKSSPRALLALFLALPGPVITPYPETYANPQPCSSISAFSSSFDFLSFIFSIFHACPTPTAFLPPGPPDVAARVLYNRQRPRMLSRPAAAIIFPLHSLNTGSVAWGKISQIPGIPCDGCAGPSVSHPEYQECPCHPNGDGFFLRTKSFKS